MLALLLEKFNRNSIEFREKPLSIPFDGQRLKFGSNPVSFFLITAVKAPQQLISQKQGPFAFDMGECFEFMRLIMKSVWILDDGLVAI